MNDIQAEKIKPSVPQYAPSHFMMSFSGSGISAGRMYIKVGAQDVYCCGWSYWARMMEMPPVTGFELQSITNQKYIALLQEFCYHSIIIL